MTSQELAALLDEKNREIKFLRSVIDRMTKETCDGHYPELSEHVFETVSEPEQKPVALEDLLENFDKRDEFCSWLLLEVTGKKTKKK